MATKSVETTTTTTADEHAKSIVENMKTAEKVAMVDLANFGGIFALHAPHPFVALLLSFAKYAMFPGTALASIILAILSVRRYHLEVGDSPFYKNYKRQTFHKAVIDVLAAGAITAAVVLSFLGSALVPIIFTASLAAKAFFHGCAALTYFIKSLTSQKFKEVPLTEEESKRINEGITDEGKKVKTKKVIDKEGTMALKNHYLLRTRRNVAEFIICSLFTVGLALLMFAAAPVLPIVGIAIGVFTAATAIIYIMNERKERKKAKEEAEKKAELDRQRQAANGLGATNKNELDITNENKLSMKERLRRLARGEDPDPEAPILKTKVQPSSTLDMLSQRQAANGLDATNKNELDTTNENKLSIKERLRRLVRSEDPDPETPILKTKLQPSSTLDILNNPKFIKKINEDNKLKSNSNTNSNGSDNESDLASEKTQVSRQSSGGSFSDKNNNLNSISAEETSDQENNSDLTEDNSKVSYQSGVASSPETEEEEDLDDNFSYGLK